MKSPLIGVGLPRWRDATVRVYEGIMAAARRHNCRTQLLGYYHPSQLLQRVDEVDLQGLILFAPLEMGQRIAEKLKPSCATVSLTLELDPLGWPTVWLDIDAAMRVAVRHLRRVGFSRFAFAGWSGIRTGDQFAKTFIQVTHDQAPMWSGPYPFNAADLENTEQAIPVDLANWLSTLEHPLGVVTMDEQVSASLTRACDRAGLKIPQDIGVVSLCDDLRCAADVPPVTAVEMPFFEMGENAVEQIARMLNGNQPDRMTTLPVDDVIARASTGMADDEAISLADAVRFIKERACHGVTVDDVLQHVHTLSRTKLYELFNQRVGRSPATEIRRVRLEQACRLLRETRHPVAEVARQSGFAHSRHFSTIFHHYMGITPTAYRSLPEDECVHIMPQVEASKMSNDE